ncbi:MAG: ornithine carbamoyltransferase, partial [Dehalococcoidia bacterium]
MKRDLISMADLSAQDIWELIREALKMKRGESKASLESRTLALIFQKPSLRTRMSFEVAMRQLGGHASYLSPQEVRMGEREPVADVARVLSRYVDGIVARTYRHADVVELARWASVPVINGLSDQEHPCQALADLLTIYEKREGFEGLKIAFIGDGNNMAASLSMGVALLGANFTLAAPEGYELKGSALATLKGLAARNGSSVEIITNVKAAAKDADVIYTDVWTSMGQEAEAEARRSAFSDYKVDPALMTLAKNDSIFMHPLP